MQPFPVERVLVHDHRLQVVDERPCIHLGAVAGGSQERVALEPLVSGDCEEPELAGAAHKTRVPLGKLFGDALPFEKGEGKVLDFHASVLLSIWALWD